MIWLLLAPAAVVIFGLGIFCGIQYAKVPVHERMAELNAMAEAAFEEAQAAKSKVMQRPYDPNGVAKRGLIVPAKKRIITL